MALVISKRISLNDTDFKKNAFTDICDWLFHRTILGYVFRE